MEGASFEVEIHKRDDFGPMGAERVEFLIAPNPGVPPAPLRETASGGELSRAMLALMTVADSGGAATLVFDEVDAGIGGRVADVVGAKLRALGSSFQVLCITHLPQIAAYADTHFVIEKQVEQGRTRTTVRRLAVDDRTEEISRMLGGSSLTSQIRASAREMLEERQGLAAKAKGETNAKGESESRQAVKAKPPRRGSPA